MATGVQFAPVNQVSFDEALRRTIRLYRDKPVWSALQRNGMATDVSWTGSAARYAALYRDTVKTGRISGDPTL